MAIIVAPLLQEAIALRGINIYSIMYRCNALPHQGPEKRNLYMYFQKILYSLILPLAPYRKVKVVASLESLYLTSNSSMGNTEYTKAKLII